MDISAPKRSKVDGMTRRKKRLYQARMEDKQANSNQSIAARKVKALSKPKKMTQFSSGDSSRGSAVGKLSKGKRGGSAFGDEKRSAKKFKARK